MTASIGGSLAVQRAGTAMSPSTGVAPQSWSFVADTSDRARAQTSRPRLRSSRTMGEPIEPVPPRTKTRTDPPYRACSDCPRYRQGNMTRMQRMILQRSASAKIVSDENDLKKFLLYSFSPDRAERHALLSRKGCDSILWSVPLLHQTKTRLSKALTIN